MNIKDCVPGNILLVADARAWAYPDRFQDSNLIVVENNGKYLKCRIHPVSMRRFENTAYYKTGTCPIFNIQYVNKVHCIGGVAFSEEVEKQRVSTVASKYKF